MKPAQRIHRLRWALLCLSAVLWLLHLLHLKADFPNDSPWSDWSKYTDEGWYGDAAIRHFVLGHWYLPGDFNPAVALPVLPLLEVAVFHFTGISFVAARALTVFFFGVMLLVLYHAMRRWEQAPAAKPSLAPTLTVLLISASPFFYAFDRMAILEPLLCALAVSTLWVVSLAQPVALRLVGWWRTLKGVSLASTLGLLFAALVLTKPTSLALLPALFPLFWARGRQRATIALSLALPPVLIAIALWSGYWILLVRPHLLEDYAYLFTANAYTGFQLEPLARVLFNTASDVRWIGSVLSLVWLASLALLAIIDQPFYRKPLVQSWLLWIGGYFVFLAYHNNLQPRYYLLLALPITALTAMALEEITRTVEETRLHLWVTAGVLVCVLAILLPDAVAEIDDVLHPEYTYWQAAQQIAHIVRATPAQSSLILSVSGSDLTLMTGLPSIDDDFGTWDLDQRVRQYRPGWYVAWNQIDDDKMDALQPLYHPVRVAAFPALDDPDRNLLILYRLDPASGQPVRPHHAKRVPRPLRTRLGQQPTTRQLEH